VGQPSPFDRRGYLFDRERASFRQQCLLGVLWQVAGAHELGRLRLGDVTGAHGFGHEWRLGESARQLDVPAADAAPFAGNIRQPGRHVPGAILTVQRAFLGQSYGAEPQRLECLEGGQPANRGGQHVRVTRIEICADAAKGVSEVIERGEHVGTVANMCSVCQALDQDLRSSMEGVHGSRRRCGIYARDRVGGVLTVATVSVSEAAIRNRRSSGWRTCCVATTSSRSTDG